MHVKSFPHGNIDGALSLLHHWRKYGTVALYQHGKELLQCYRALSALSVNYDKLLQSMGYFHETKVQNVFLNNSCILFLMHLSSTDGTNYRTKPASFSKS